MGRGVWVKICPEEPQALMISVVILKAWKHLKIFKLHFSVSVCVHVCTPDWMTNVAPICMYLRGDVYNPNSHFTPLFTPWNVNQNSFLILPRCVAGSP